MTAAVNMNGPFFLSFVCQGDSHVYVAKLTFKLTNIIYGDCGRCGSEIGGAQKIQVIL